MRLLSCLFVLVFLLCFVDPVSAHGEEPRLEINVERVNPGGVVDVRGVDFDYEQVVTLTLETNGIGVQLGEVVTDIEGVFVYFAALPVDLPEGKYQIRAAREHHDDVLSPALKVQGPAIVEESGGQGERDEDDGLLAPMPTYAPDVAPQQTVPAVAQEMAQAQPASGPYGTVILLSLIVLGAGIAAFRSARARQR